MNRIIEALFGGGSNVEARETYPVIVLNNPAVNSEKDFPRNEIWTTKYTFLTFIPKVLFEQFRKFTSLYFLLVCIISFIPSISPINPWSSVSGLLFILGVSMIREAVEDFFRYKADRQANRRKYSVVESGSGNKISRQSRHLVVGDLLYLTANEPLPADIVVLATGLDDSVCYIETAQLDGETNLKLRRGSSATMGLTIKEIAEIDANLECGVPVHELYKFKGSLDVKSLGRSSAISGTRGVSLDTEWERRKTELGKSSDDERFASARLLALPPSPSLIRRGEQHVEEEEVVEIESDAIPKDSMLSRFRVPSVIGLDLGGTKRVSGPMMCSLGEDNMLPRGSVLRNTPWMLGVIAYAGFETKMSLNTKTPPSKFSSLDKRINKYVFFIFIFQLVLIFICGVWAAVYEHNASINMWYLDMSSEGSAFFTGVRAFFSYFILMSFLIPISLVVTLEVTKVVQGRFMEWDEQLKYEGDHMTVKTSNLNDELGLVQYVFSDKTGTLTQNQMDFKKVSVKGFILDDATNDRLFQAYKYAQSDEEAQSTYELLLCLAICHSVVPEVMEDGKIYYKAASPDEEALCRGAADNRFRFLHRDSTGIDLEIDGQPSHYEVLCTMPFTSERRRMSVIVRLPNGVIRLYSKGADATIIARLSKDESRELVATTERNLEAFSQDGLRTLVLATKDISKQDFKIFSDKYFVASNDMGDREGKVEAVCDEIERNLFIVGCTAIEDKLQEFVPETIDYLLRAGIRVWVITGDKQATAINIGYSTQLLTKQTRLYKLNANSPNSLEQLLREYLEETRQQSGSYQLGLEAPAIWSMVVDGESLQYGLDTCPELLLEFAKSCHSVICCRVAPLQKAAVVKLVKDSLDCCTLSIGDGGNDVSMIQEANIGVGIYGKEGSQAARSSDYAIHRFHHLQRLLTVHGRYSLVRNALLTHYSFYKNASIFLIQVWFAFFCGCTGQSLFDDWIMTFFNIYITALPPFILGVFEIDITDHLIQKYPKSFLRTQTNQIFTLFTLMIWLSSALYHSLVLFFGAYLLFHDSQLGNGQDSNSLSMMGMWVIITGIVVIFSKLFFEVTWWTLPMHAAVWISVASFAFTVLAENSIATLFPSQYYVLYKTFQSLSFWFYMFITVTICLLPDFVAKYVQRQYFPQDWQLLQEREIWEHEERKKEKKRLKKGESVESQSLMAPHQPSKSYGLEA